MRSHIFPRARGFSFTPNLRQPITLREIPRYRATQGRDNLRIYRTEARQFSPPDVQVFPSSQSPNSSENSGVFAFSVRSEFRKKFTKLHLYTGLLFTALRYPRYQARKY